MADYVKLNLSEIETTVSTTESLINALEEQKSTASDLKDCLDTENQGLWAQGAALRVSAVITKVDTTLSALKSFNDVQKDYLAGLQERTGTSGEVVINAAQYRHGIDQISGQIDVISNQGGWESVLWSTLPSGLLDIVTMLAEQGKAEENAQILKTIMNEIKPGYVQQLYWAVDGLRNVLYNNIEPLMDFDEQIASRASQAYETSISSETKNSIYWGKAWGGVNAFGAGLSAWGNEFVSGIQQLFGPDTVENMINNATGIINWLLSQGAVVLGDVFRIDEEMYKKLLSDIRAGDVERFGLGDSLEYIFSQGLIDSINKNGLAFTLGSVAPDVALVFVPAAKVAQGYKIAVKEVTHGATSSSGKAGRGAAGTSITGYEAIKGIKSIKDLPADVQEVYYKYHNHGWQGTYPGQGLNTRAGGEWRNREKRLPENDSDGRPIVYKEWDIDDKVSGENRTRRRFVTGSDGSIFFTDEHYEEFIKIKEGK